MRTRRNWFEQSSSSSSSSSSSGSRWSKDKLALSVDCRVECAGDSDRVEISRVVCLQLETAQIHCFLQTLVPWRFSAVRGEKERSG
jgi:hypothetical protein